MVEHLFLLENFYLDFHNFFMFFFFFSYSIACSLVFFGKKIACWSLLFSQYLSSRVPRVQTLDLLSIYTHTLGDLTTLKITYVVMTPKF